MRIVFTTEHRNAPSTILNLSCLKELGAYPDVTFTAFPEDLSEADVILFMGYDPDIRAARAKPERPCRHHRPASGHTAQGCWRGFPHGEWAGNGGNVPRHRDTHLVLPYLQV